jgi:hypothetical protein
VFGSFHVVQVRGVSGSHYSRENLRTGCYRTHRGIEIQRTVSLYSKVKSNTEGLGGELGKEEKLKDYLLIICILVLLLKITVDNFPFGLSYVGLYDRYGKIRRTVRHCLAVYPHNDAYRNALLKLDRGLTSVIEDNQIKTLVTVLKADYKIFGRLREILENRDKNSREVVEGKMWRFYALWRRKR